MTSEKNSASSKGASQLSEKFLVRREFAVFAGVMQGDVGVRSFIKRVDFTTGIRMGVDVNAGGALIEFGEIEDLMDRFFALHGAGMIVVHVIGNAGRDTASAAGVILILDAKILNAEFANRYSHPTILPAMIVNAAGLANFPADGEHFEEAALIDEIPRVVALGVEKVRLESIRENLILLEIFFDLRKREILTMNGRKAADPLIDLELRHEASCKCKAVSSESIAPAREIGAEKNVSIRVL